MMLIARAAYLNPPQPPSYQPGLTWDTSFRVNVLLYMLVLRDSRIVCVLLYKSTGAFLCELKSWFSFLCVVWDINAERV
jgi:hypothetical protein